jgi:hypothetical protein
MGVRKTGKWGKLMLPVNDGVPNTNVELTKVASQDIGGQTYANLFYAHAQTHWNKAKPITVTLQGILGEVVVTPGVAGDDVVVGPMRYVKDDAGSILTTARTSIALTRHATDHQQHTIQIVMASGSVVATAGTGHSIFTDSFGGLGGPISVPVANLLVQNIQLEPLSVATVVTGTEIGNGLTLTTGVLVQERADMPTFEIIPLDGGVLLTAIPLACHVGAVGRKVYATFYSQKTCLDTAAHTTKWSTSTSNPVTTMPAQGDTGVEADSSGAGTTTGSFELYATSELLNKLVVNKKRGYVRLYRDRNETQYREAAVIFTSIGDSCDQGAAMLETVAFTVDKNIEWRN